MTINDLKDHNDNGCSGDGSWASLSLKSMADDVR